jgi:hypothetical protein
MIDPQLTAPAAGACTRRIAAASSGTKATSLGTGRVEPAAMAILFAVDEPPNADPIDEETRMDMSGFVCDRRVEGQSVLAGRLLTD